MKKGLFLNIALMLLSSMVSIKEAKAQVFSFSIPLKEPALTSASGVAVDGNGNIYVSLSTAHQVLKLGPTGDEILRIGTFGAADGEFNLPQGAAVDIGGSIYVADTGNDRIQKFDSSGKFLLKFGTNGSKKGEFDTPSGITLDSDGNIYVVDTRNKRIEKGTFTLPTHSITSSRSLIQVGFSNLSSAPRAPVTVSLKSR